MGDPDCSQQPVATTKINQDEIEPEIFTSKHNPHWTNRRSKCASCMHIWHYPLKIFANLHVYVHHACMSKCPFHWKYSLLISKSKISPRGVNWLVTEWIWDLP